ncbi:aminoglycoside phosphotransferase family protein [Geodermatophilus sp. YIM 151500]|uniref:aminoglycoside phosphotransferase family protein n=1 Tax=Geodermatophilus sp. YIM 151500 TaxID=2984531 RepID=UPI0021E456F4|nr:aminoglycoside phosphotransferase family protein [Geodermatophilus sp. YIM 151500]MCV2491934.1 aminoglycoside phosphotransferase family protein [Geodermatophilus sp. YIM 151500]
MTPDGTTGTRTWQDPGWRAGALGWARERLAGHGLVPNGAPGQPHVMPWSTALRLPVRGGAVWLKAVGPGSAHEPALAAALGDWAPARALVPLAVEPGRRLLLLPDGGTTLRDSGRAGRVEAWEAVLADYARLQVEVAPHAAAMLDLGVPDARPERLPDQVAGLLADDDALLVGRDGGATADVRDALVAELPRYRELCDRLAASGIPPTVQHDDLHDGNVFVAGSLRRFFDWGDASVSHPFLSLLVALRMAARALGVPHGHPTLTRLRDAYLAPWRDVGDPRDLVEPADIALRVAPLARALSWWRILAGVDPAERAEWAAAVPGWAAAHLGAGPLAPARPDG